MKLLTLIGTICVTMAATTTVLGSPLTINLSTNDQSILWWHKVQSVSTTPIAGTGGVLKTTKKQNSVIISTKPGTYYHASIVYRVGYGRLTLTLPSILIHTPFFCDVKITIACNTPSDIITPYDSCTYLSYSKQAVPGPEENPCRFVTGVAVTNNPTSDTASIVVKGNYRPPR